MRLSDNEYGIDKFGEIRKGKPGELVASCTHTDVRLYAKPLRR